MKDKNLSRATYSRWVHGRRMSAKNGLAALRRLYNQAAYGNPNPPKKREDFQFMLGHIKVRGWSTVLKMAEFCKKDFPNCAKNGKRMAALMWALLTLDREMTKRGIK